MGAGTRICAGMRWDVHGSDVIAAAYVGGMRCGVFSGFFSRSRSTNKVRLGGDTVLNIVVVVSGQLLAELDSQCYEVLRRRPAQRSCSP